MLQPHYATRHMQSHKRVPLVSLQILEQALLIYDQDQVEPFRFRPTSTVDPILAANHAVRVQDADEM
jgi:hypothetical protein